jgi:hypothetical protein
MTDRPQPVTKVRLTLSKLGALLLVIFGIVFCQSILYGPSLVGTKILLPLDILSSPKVYTPSSAATFPPVIQNSFLSDLVYGEPFREFCVSELKAGRPLLWNPYQFGGTMAIVPQYSPFWFLLLVTKSPIAYAYTQLLVALVAGIGAYFFFSRVLKVNFWPAAIGGWCFPMTGFFVFWQGYPTSRPVCWLPWILLAVDGTVRSRWRSFAPIALVLLTWLVITSGNFDIAGQVLFISGLYGLWCLYDEWLRRKAYASALRAACVLSFAWLLGFLLTAHLILPAVEYIKSGARMTERSGGSEERPPGGIAALPQTVLPDMYGSDWRSKTGFRFVAGNQLESSAAAYSGVIASLLLAPLAFYQRTKSRSIAIWAFLAVFGLSWCLNTVGFVDLLRLPGLNMMSHNRLVFATSFSLLALAVIGLNLMQERALQWRPWMWLPAGVLAGITCWCIYRSLVPPEQIAKLVQTPNLGRSLNNLNEASHTRNAFVTQYTVAATLCLIGTVGWFLIRFYRELQASLLAICGVLLVGDLLWFASGRSIQSDPALYFPRIPVLEELSQKTKQRVVGYNCLPPLLPLKLRLHDVRGYDGIDPARWVDIIRLTADRGFPSYSYSATQWMAPRTNCLPNGDFGLSPILDMLSVRYIIFRGSPPTWMKPMSTGEDYYVIENPRALDRVFVPRNVRCIADRKKRLERLASSDFAPLDVAFVETPLLFEKPCAGFARIASEEPSRVSIAAEMQTPGLVVLSDRWVEGWNAYLDGSKVPILVVNHAIRGVVVPGGTHTIEYRFEPASLASGLKISFGSLLVLISWLIATAFQKRRRISAGLALH